MRRSRVLTLTILLALCALLLSSGFPAGPALAQEGNPAAPAQGDVANAPEGADATQAALTSAFTYQGNLKKSGQPVSATCSFQFSLWDAASAGAQKGTTQTINNVAVQAGVFTVQLDFGSQFTGDARWLETAVKCARDGSFTTLTPRQPLNAVPYALSLRPGAQVTGASNTTDGIVRATNSGQGAALVGMATSSTGTTYGVLGNAFSPNGFAVWGYGEKGATGVRGAATANGLGVWGSSGSGFGVLGESSSGFGVGGHSQYGYGVVGSSIESSGVLGETYAANTLNAAGVRGYSGGAGGIGVKGSASVGNGWGVYGTGNGAGVVGESTSGVGTSGTSTSGNGVSGFSDSGTGVYGQSRYVGVRGDNGGANTGSWAGYFNGRVTVVGNLSKGGGSFTIDHPLDPLNKYLQHSFVESPDMMNIYNGNTTTDARGFATVILPDWFEALNRDFRYQLTVIGQFAQAIVAEEIKDNRFLIQTDRPGVKVSWQVTGIRHDPYAEQNRIQVEVDKTTVERGKYLYPAAYGRPMSEGIATTTMPQASAPAMLEGKQP